MDIAIKTKEVRVIGISKEQVVVGLVGVDINEIIGDFVTKFGFGTVQRAIEPYEKYESEKEDTAF